VGSRVRNISYRTTLLPPSTTPCGRARSVTHAAPTRTHSNGCEGNETSSRPPCVCSTPLLPVWLGPWCCTGQGCPLRYTTSKYTEYCSGRAACGQARCVHKFSHKILEAVVLIALLPERRSRTSDTIMHSRQRSGRSLFGIAFDFGERVHACLAASPAGRLRAGIPRRARVVGLGLVPRAQTRNPHSGPEGLRWHASLSLWS
jgi:hypothetical protein